MVPDKLLFENRPNPVSEPSASGPEAVRLEILTLVVEMVAHFCSMQFIDPYQGPRTQHKGACAILRQILSQFEDLRNESKMCEV